jgi:hypothetical protein
MIHFDKQQHASRIQVVVHLLFAVVRQSPDPDRLRNKTGKLL